MPRPRHVVMGRPAETWVEAPLGISEVEQSMCAFRGDVL